MTEPCFTFKIHAGMGVVRTCNLYHQKGYIHSSGQREREREKVRERHTHREADWGKKCVANIMCFLGIYYIPRKRMQSWRPTTKQNWKKQVKADFLKVNRLCHPWTLDWKLQEHHTDHAQSVIGKKTQSKVCRLIHSLSACFSGSLKRQ